MKNNKFKILENGIDAIYTPKHLLLECNSFDFSKYHIYPKDVLLINPTFASKPFGLGIFEQGEDISIQRIKNIQGTDYLIPENSQLKPIPLQAAPHIKWLGNIDYVFHAPKDY
jgi:hypothetical protein